MYNRNINKRYVHVAVQKKRQRRWLTWTCKNRKDKTNRKRERKEEKNIQIIICSQAINECIDSISRIVLCENERRVNTI